MPQLLGKMPSNFFYLTFSVSQSTKNPLFLIAGKETEDDLCCPIQISFLKPKGGK